jgi:hypothetical protein
VKVNNKQERIDALNAERVQLQGEINRAAFKMDTKAPYISDRVARVAVIDAILAALKGGE